MCVSAVRTVRAVRAVVVVVVVGVMGAVVVVVFLSESLPCPLAGADLKWFFGFEVIIETILAKWVWKDVRTGVK